LDIGAKVAAGAKVLDERLAIVVDSAGMVSVHLNHQPQPTPLNARKKKYFF